MEVKLLSRSTVDVGDVAEAIDKYSDMVRRICFLYLKNYADVEDIFQEVFLKYFMNASKFENEKHEKAWLCSVTFNQCKDFKKSFWRKNVVDASDDGHNQIQNRNQMQNNN